ncbi:MAG: LLM class flavin-dependent oxidoreductase [Acidobacteriota bacterium]|jgi:alkanesulfonate monooxygenase SsuD/methylene tetrahydromethanopterin reductase-like flavin-dependent oxidoreductase (luciferase family)
MGALLGPLADAASPRALAEQARTYAGEGFTSLWSAQAVGRGFMITDPLIALTVAATVTDEVEIGTAVLQVPLYPAMDLAHRVFSLQQLCGERLILGVGAGSTAADFAAFGRDYAARFASFQQSVDALREILATGSHDDVTLSPWPNVLGGPPLLLGSWGNGVERAAREFDGWIASAAYRSVEEIESAARRYREAGGGRSIVSTIQIGADTDLGALREKLHRFAEAGFDDAVVMILPGGPPPGDVRKLVRTPQA